MSLVVGAEMVTKVKAVLTLLTGSSLCCSQDSGLDEGLHHIQVTHPGGQVTSFTLSTKFEPEDRSKKLWGQFERAKLSVDVMNFSQLRHEAARALRYFTGEPVPFVNGACDVAQPPDFWRVVVPLKSLTKSRSVCYHALGKRQHIRLEDIIPWVQMRPVKDARADLLKNAKSPHKALLTVIVEVANYLSHQYQVERAGSDEQGVSCHVGCGNDVILEVSIKEYQMVL